MSWRLLTGEDVFERLSPAEKTSLNGIQGSRDLLVNRIEDSVGKFIGALIAAGYPVGSDGEVPDQLRNFIMADARWEWLIDFSSMKYMQTEEREAIYNAAQVVYGLIVTKQYGAVEAPSGVVTTTGNWNSHNKIVGRMEPVPAPQTQSVTLSGKFYANPKAPSDIVPV